jgi:translation initiation factor 1
MAGADKLATDGGQGLRQDPFGALSGAGLPVGPGSLPVATNRVGAGSKPIEPKGNRGRVDIIRETAGRGGKIVTVVTGFTGIGLPEKESLAKKMRAAAGCGGTVKDGRIEIQGDQRENVARVLREAGFRPVLAGG